MSRLPALLASLLGFTGAACAESWLHPDYVIRHYTVEDGLPVNAVSGVRMGPQGFLWITTFDGLARFDGAGFRTWRRAMHPDMSSNRLIDLIPVGQDMWLVTAGRELVRLRDGRAERLDRLHDIASARIQAWAGDGDDQLLIAAVDAAYLLQEGRSTRLCGYPDHLEIDTLLPRGESGALLVTRNQGIHVCDGTVRELLAPDRLAPPVIASVLHGSELWFVDGRGFNRFNSGRIRSVPLPENPVERSRPTAFMLGIGDEAWIAIDRFVYRISDGRVQPVSAEPVQLHSRARFAQIDAEGARWLSRGHELTRDDELVLRAAEPVTDFALADDGSVWVGTDGGLLRLRPRIGEVFGDQPALTDAILYAVAASPSRPDRVWLGGMHGRGGLISLEKGVATPVPLSALPADSSPIWALHEDRRGLLWVGGDALCRLTPDGAGCSGAGLPPELADPERVRSVHMVMEDAAGSIWVGASNGLWHSVGGDVLFDRVDGTGPAPVRVGLQRRDGSLWFGTSGDGMFRWRAGKLQPVDLGPLALRVRSLYEDARQVLWVGTEDQGLLRIEGTADVAGLVRRFGPAEGLWDDVIHHIVEDGRGRLWMNSNRGIFWIERDLLESWRPGSGHPLPVVGYTESDGLRDREGNGGAHSSGLLDGQGRIWFPSQRGVVRIDPGRVDRPIGGPAVVIDAVALDGVELAATGPLVLPADRGDLSIHYASAVFRHPERARFRYRLHGYDRDWVEAGARREAIYPQLPAGEYRFQVIAADGYGQWNDAGVELAVRALPRWHEHPASMVLAMLLVAGFVAAAYRFRVAKLRERSRQLQQEVDLRTCELRHEKGETEKALAQLALQARQLRELDATKSRFFTNLSHELRTPLTLILGPAEQALQSQQLAPQTGAQLRSIRNNAERLLELVDQILALARLDAGQQRLAPRPGDLAAACRNLVSRFAPAAAARELRLSAPPESLRCRCAFDPDALDKILGNLLANALRHTPAGGEVRVLLEPITGGVKLCVDDQGPGVPTERIGRVFDRFYTAAHEGSGSGIGLALARELAHLHGGGLDVVNRDEGGSRFQLVLVIDPIEWHQRAEQPKAFDGDKGEARKDSAKSVADRLTVLVVDDDPEIRSFVASCLRGRHRVLEAADGRSGLEAARASLPDVIVSDVMMPGLDGHQLVRALAADPTTTSIPVILLTARSGEVHEVEGLGSGAIDYLTKPFAPQILLARVQRLLSYAGRLREQLRLEHAQMEASVSAMMPTTPLQRIDQALRKNLGDPAFDVDQLAAATHVSRSQLKRLLAEAGRAPPSVLIREHRLDEAARLLQSGRGSVTEVAYATGFSSHSHFARRFRERFGVNPSEYSGSVAGAAG